MFYYYKLCFIYLEIFLNYKCLLENIQVDMKKKKKLKNKQNTTKNLGENITNGQEIHQKELDNNEIIQQKYINENNHNNVQLKRNFSET